MDNYKDEFKDIEYTVVMDRNYIGPDTGQLGRIEKKKETASGDRKAAIDRLYSDYEAIWLRDPTILDVDDIYPHTYQWRLGDKYDAARVKVVEEAIRLGKKIAETEAYEKYAEEVSRMKFTPDSWD